MSNWKNALYAQLAYMGGMGLFFLLAPNVLLPILGLEPTHEIWIHILGMLVMALTFYYYLAIRQENMQFLWASVWGRYMFCAGLLALGLLFGLYIFILFAAVESGLALWAQRTLPQAA